VECQHFFGQRLVAGQDQSGRTGTRVAEVDQVEERRHIRFQRALPAERLGEVEDEVGCFDCQLVDERLNFGVDREPPRGMTATEESVLELVQHRINRWLERVLAVEDRDLQSSSAGSVPSISSVWR
jgi:hypothetical protein